MMVLSNVLMMKIIFEWWNNKQDLKCTYMTAKSNFLITITSVKGKLVQTFSENTMQISNLVTKLKSNF